MTGYLLIDHTAVGAVSARTSVCNMLATWRYDVNRHTATRPCSEVACICHRHMVEASDDHRQGVCRCMLHVKKRCHAAGESLHAA